MELSIAVHENKNSEKVIKFINSRDELRKYCSLKTTAKIIVAHNHGFLWGAYFTKSGKIMATFI